MKPAFLSASIILLAITLPLRAGDRATCAYRQHIAAVCTAGTAAETPDDLAEDFSRIARELGEMPPCGVAADVMEAAHELRAVAEDLHDLLGRAAQHRRHYGDPSRVFVETLARGLVGEGMSLQREMKTSRGTLRTDLQTCEESLEELSSGTGGSRAAGGALRTGFRRLWSRAAQRG